jgi:hypothetical protein
VSGEDDGGERERMFDVEHANGEDELLVEREVG